MSLRSSYSRKKRQRWINPTKDHPDATKAGMGDVITREIGPKVVNVTNRGQLFKQKTHIKTYRTILGIRTMGEKNPRNDDDILVPKPG
jgi:hypothetical protein